MNRYIDADKLKSDIKEVADVTDGKLTEFEVLGILSGQPTADVVEVVRCQDCKHFDTGYCGIPFIGEKVNSNHYCSYGERKDESSDEDDIQPNVCSTCHWCLNDWHQEPCNICVHGSKWKDGR